MMIDLKGREPVVTGCTAGIGRAIAEGLARPGAAVVINGRGEKRVVFISSESALAIPKEMVDHGMTKTARLAIARSVAESVAGTGATVNAVLPGPTRSEIQSNWMKAPAESDSLAQEQAEQNVLKTMRPTPLLQRFTTTDEVAYPCSGQASGTTGAALRVDGGVLRQVA